MARLSIGEAWVMSLDSFRRDGHLMAPVTLALVGLPGMIFSLLIPRDQVQALVESGRPAAWMLFIVPILLIGLVNSLAVAAMVLVPRISVGEALRLGSRRLPVFVAAIALFAAVGVVAGAIAALFAVLSPVLGALLVFAAALAMVFVGIRLILLPPLVVAEAIRPIEALRRAWRLSRGSFWRLLGFMLIVVLANLVLDLAVGTAGNALALLIGRVAGGPGFAEFLAALMAAIAASAVTLLIVVMTANLYRQAATAAA